MDQTLFTAICFFLLGFNFILGLISLFMHFIFKLRTYIYYFGYLFLTLICVFMVFTIKIDLLEEGILKQLFVRARDPIGVMAFYMHAHFSYSTVVAYQKSDLKYQWLLRLYFLMAVLHFIISIFFSGFIEAYPQYFFLHRVIILCSAIKLTHLIYQKTYVKYFRYHFIGSMILFVFVGAGVWESSLELKPMEYKNFQWIYLGIIIENTWFVFALVDHIIVTNRKRRALKLLDQNQLISIEKEIQNHTAQYLGREIHDNVGQKIILASLSIKQLSMEQPDTEILKKTNHINQILDDTLEQLRGLTKSMVDQEIENKNIAQILENKCAEIRKIKPCNFSYNPKTKEIEINHKTKVVLVRILQEFSQNSIKHSGCKEISAHFSIEKSNLVLFLKDDGIGFDLSTLSQTEGIGLKNIQKRTALIGGRSFLSSSPNLGTQLKIEAPLR